MPAFLNAAQVLHAAFYAAAAVGYVIVPRRRRGVPHDVATRADVARVREVVEGAREPAKAKESEELTAQLLEVCALLRASGATVPEALDKQLAEIEDPAVLSDVIAHTFLRDPERRQAVFEELRVAARVRLLIRFLLGEMPDESAQG